MLRLSGLVHRLLRHKAMPLSALLRGLAEDIELHSLRLIAITGPSSVGKTTGAEELKNGLIDLGGSAATLKSDDWLEEGLRGDTLYRRSVAYPLTPEDYDFNGLGRCVSCLLQGSVVRWKGYERGQGWTKQNELAPANVVIVEGLFLDSKPAIAAMRPDLMIVIEASSHAIARWRRARDEAVRRAGRSPFRTSEETEQEIARTGDAYEGYVRDSSFSSRILVKVDVSHNVTAVEGAWPD